MLHRCTKPEHADYLFGPLADIPINDRVQFLESLCLFVAHLHSELWHDLGPILAKGAIKARPYDKQFHYFQKVCEAIQLK